MPLDSSGLASAIQSICENPPNGPAAAGQAWADAVGSYASGVVPPSTTVSAAKATLAGALGTAFSSPAAAPGMELAFAAFGATVAGGMLPTFTGTPPAGPVGFASQFAGPKPPDRASAAAAIAGLIDAWMKTGSATLVAPPNTVIPWS